ncbi:type II toxin-antitoxin system Phd/YefM family antitoxin [Oscillochloris sp. ZM17-4]|uniref:type II toxin-antitoxin system Phd/YefM family antitoxin n=1 Tax=Oscillochloris sp. ZM17-4 TaxID=2866714 RepID=UPI001C73D33F|nr:type II toxin-antitoxin system Phd/YefM family antitoxin [Oscillochloris sp. ZM17-4]MBX0330116.1 type II toxin-antitoxin system Phd/YefM family antitoxin [Oscillochloris sp. ZM17-4]
MARTWQLQEAKNRLSEVVDEALTHGPQIITRRGIETAIVLSYAEYQRLALSRVGISTFFRESPLAAAAEDLDLARDSSPPRPDIAL